MDLFLDSRVASKLQLYILLNLFLQSMQLTWDYFLDFIFEFSLVEVCYGRKL